LPAGYRTPAPRSTKVWLARGTRRRTRRAA
jgi:hypothetical protein